MLEKSIFATIAIVISGLSFVPYIWSIFRGTVRPHVLSWSIWGLTTTIVFFAQRAGGAGVGAWPVGISALLAFPSPSLLTLNVPISGFRQQTGYFLVWHCWLFLCGSSHITLCGRFYWSPLWMSLDLARRFARRIASLKQSLCCSLA